MGFWVCDDWRIIWESVDCVLGTEILEPIFAAIAVDLEIYCQILI